jgi:hypothetical protein
MTNYVASSTLRTGFGFKNSDVRGVIGGEHHFTSGRSNKSRRSVAVFADGSQIKNYKRRSSRSGSRDAIKASASVLERPVDIKPLAAPEYEIRVFEKDIGRLEDNDVKQKNGD